MMKSNTLSVEKIINGGHGLGRREDGRVILLPGVLPGEKVRYTVVDKRKGTLFGRVVEVLAENPERIEPPCPYYGDCGGCDLQHCSCEAQTAIKTGIISELFQGMIRKVEDCVPSPKQFGYRQRIRLQIDGTRMGFYRFRSSEVVPITACLLAHPAINEVLADILKNDHFGLLLENGRELELLYNPETHMVILLLHCKRRPRPADRYTAGELAATVEKIDRIFFAGDDFSMEGPFPNPGKGDNDSKLLGYHFANTGSTQNYTLNWEVGAFCQVNLEQNEQLISHVLQCSQSRKSHSIIDLFCGMGNFSIPLAMRAQTLLGVEGQGASVRCAKKNCSVAGLANATFKKGAIEQVCTSLVAEKQGFDIAVVDPPRQGIGGLAPLLASLTRQKIIYISCDPATLTRDIRELQQRNFRLNSLRPFDMFPQTHHIETVAELEKH